MHAYINAFSPAVIALYALYLFLCEFYDFVFSFQKQNAGTPKMVQKEKTETQDTAYS